MKLTQRQADFLNTLWDLCEELGGAVPYALVAERLGASSFTAYDMLKVLEAKGMVTSVYGMPKARTGPGRSPVLFLPLSKDTEPDEEWKRLRHRLLQRIRHLLPGQSQTVIRELGRDMEHAPSPLAYCAQVVTALMLLVKRGSRGRGRELEIGSLLANTEPRLQVGAFTAFIAGLVLSGSGVGQVLPRFREHVRRYETFLHSLAPEQLEALRGYIREAIAMLTGKRLQEQQ